MELDLREYMNTVGETTKSKGFRTDDHVTQLLLFADEVVEALEHISVEADATPDLENGLDVKQREIYFVRRYLTDAMDDLRVVRKDKATPFNPLKSSITNPEALAEELADIIIRVLSYSYGNNLPLIEALQKKAEKNKSRAAMHDRAF